MADLSNASPLRLLVAANSVKPKSSIKVSPECSSSKSSFSSAGSSYPKIPGDTESPKSTTVSKGITTSVSGIVNGKKIISTSKRGGQSTVNLELVKEKRKNDSSTEAFSCPAVRRSHKLRNSSLMQHDMNQNTAYSEPCQKKKKRCLGPDGSRFADDNIPLEDFIQKQRAYFAEVDSFELPVEAVSESELE